MSSSDRNDEKTFIALCRRFGGIGTSRPTVVTVYLQHCDNTNWNAMGLDGTLCDPGIGELQESDMVQLRNFVRNNRYVLERIAENDLYSEDQIASQLILGGAAASEEAVAELKRKADEIIARNDRKWFASKGERGWLLSSFFKRNHPELPSNIWILAKDEDRPRGPRMRIPRNKSDMPQVEDAYWMTIADAPETIGPTGFELSAQDFDYLKNFIVRNKAILLAHWNGEIGSEEVARGLAFSWTGSKPSDKINGICSAASLFGTRREVSA